MLEASIELLKYFAKLQKKIPLRDKDVTLGHVLACVPTHLRWCQFDH